MLIKDSITDTSTDALKKVAWQLKKETGIKHHEALDIVARKFGYKNWSMLMLARSKAEAE